MTQTDELVERLRNMAGRNWPVGEPRTEGQRTTSEAADLLTSQASEIAKLREALEKIAALDRATPRRVLFEGEKPNPIMVNLKSIGDLARTALSERKTT